MDRGRGGGPWPCRGGQTRTGTWTGAGPSGHEAAAQPLRLDPRVLALDWDPPTVLVVRAKRERLAAPSSQRDPEAHEGPEAGDVCVPAAHAHPYVFTSWVCGAVFSCNLLILHPLPGLPLHDLRPRLPPAPGQWASMCHGLCRPPSGAALAPPRRVLGTRGAGCGGCGAHGLWGAGHRALGTGPIPGWGLNVSAKRGWLALLCVRSRLPFLGTGPSCPLRKA